MYAVRCLRPFGTSLHFSHSGIPIGVKFSPLKTLMRCVKPQVYSPVSKFTGGSNFRTYQHYFKRVYTTTMPQSQTRWGHLYASYLRRYHKSGQNHTFWSAFGLLTLLGSIKPFPHTAYSSNGFDARSDEHHLGVFNDADSEEDRRSLIILLKKLLVPLMFMIYVLKNWGNPWLVALNVTTFLLTTKPSPLSVYVVVEQLRHQVVRQQPFLYKFKSLYAKKIEVSDYLFLSLAKVELADQEFTLVGILGSWWILPISSWQEASSMLKCKISAGLSLRAC